HCTAIGQCQRCTIASWIQVMQDRGYLFGIRYLYTMHVEIIASPGANQKNSGYSNPAINRLLSYQTAAASFILNRASGDMGMDLLVDSVQCLLFGCSNSMIIIWSFQFFPDHLPHLLL